MSETPSPAPTQAPTPAPVPPAATTTSPAPSDKPSLVGGSAPAEWKEYTPDETKTAEENAALKAEHDKSKPAPAEPKTPAFEPVDLSKIKLPEGFSIPEETGKELTTILNDQSLSRSELTQKLIDLQAKSVTDLTKSLSEKGKEDWDKVQEGWREQCQKDPDIGGEKLKVAEAAMGQLLDTYGTRELRAVFDLTGAGNHPEMVKFLTKIAAKLNEPAAPAPATPGSTPKDAAKIMFPSMKG